ncbi:hypothetical protein [Acidiphilium sp.]|uniref:hypothetical protein n=1 Tax=Acidiphilium sp. TaxID=527 RepID=UPI003D0269BD
MSYESNEADVADDVIEARVRRSLGLNTTPSPNHAFPNADPNTGVPTHGNARGSDGSAVLRRRFVRDGEVPVVILHPKSGTENRHAATIADLSRQCDTERAARLRAELALHDARVTIQTLETRLAHAEIERTERSAIPPVEPVVFPSTADPASPVKAIAPARAMKPARAVNRTRRTEPKVHEDQLDPTPVKWWR